MRKYILGAVLSLGLLASPLFASAAGLTSMQIQSILSLLSAFGADQSVISNVQVALNGGTPTTGGSSFCYNFNSDLTVGNSGADVSALNQALTASGVDTTNNTASFTENTAGDVVSFQAKYGIRQTGYVGPLTRGRLNALYGCGNNQQSTGSTLNGTVATSGTGATSQPTNNYNLQITSTSAKAAGNFEMDAGGSVSIYGTYLAGNGNTLDTTKVFIGGIQAPVKTIYNSASNNSVIFAMVPISLNAGQSYDMYISNEKGTSNVVRIKILSAPTSQPSITILSPNGGENISIDSNVVVKLATNSSNLLAFENVGMAITNQAGNNLVLFKQSHLDSNEYYWHVGQDVPVGSYRLYVVVTDKNDGHIIMEDYSNSFFTISSPTGLTASQVQAILSLLSTFGASSVTITNMTNVLNGGAVPSSVASSGLTSTQIQSITSLLTSFGASSTIIANAGVVLSTSSTKIPTPTISPITVLLPNGGEVWHPGETHRISWTPNAVNNVKIYIYDSNVFGSGSTNFITPNGNAVSGLSGYYDWVIPSLNQLPPFNGLGSANYKVRIDNADTNIVLDSSNAPFGIASAIAAASTLTSAQIQSILSLLTTFNANSTTVANMNTVLNGGTLSTTPPVLSGLTSAQIQSILSLLSSFGANSTIIANVITVLGTSSTPPPTATLSSSSANVAPGGTVFLYFSSTNATSCTAPSGNWLGSSGAIGGSYITNPITSNITFTLQCTGPGGTSPLQSVTVAVGIG